MIRINKLLIHSIWPPWLASIASIQPRKLEWFEMARTGHDPAYIAKTLKYNCSTVLQCVQQLQGRGQGQKEGPQVQEWQKKNPHVFGWLEKVHQWLTRYPNVSPCKKENCGQVNSLRRHKEWPQTEVLQALQETHIDWKDEGQKGQKWDQVAEQPEVQRKKTGVLFWWKNWTVDRSYNVQNDRYLASDRSTVPHVFTTKFPNSIMTLGVICSNGAIMPPTSSNQWKGWVQWSIVRSWMRSSSPGWRRWLGTLSLSSNKTQPQPTRPRWPWICWRPKMWLFRTPRPGPLTPLTWTP